jgi:SAM-dependent methyltransferase
MSEPPPSPPSTPPQFPKTDPATAAFWDLRFDASFTPWDQGGVPRQLKTYLESNPVPSTVLIPGCGTGYEVAYFAERGSIPLAIDFSHAAVTRARAQLGPYASLVREADFFAPIDDDRFDAIYERAFLCALPRRMWRAWAARVANLLLTGGRLFGFFYTDGSERGPPFGLVPGELETLLSQHFTREQNVAVKDSISVFAGKESWQVWRRR